MMDSESKTKEWITATFKTNLLTLYEREKHARKHLCKELHVSFSTVSSWTADNNRIPQPQYLPDIAEHLGVSIDWLFSDHTKEKVFRKTVTYAEAFSFLQPLVERKIIDINGVQDVILQRLLETEIRIIEDPNVPDIEKQQWLTNVMEWFDIPMPETCIPGFIDYLYDHIPERTRSADLIRTCANIAKEMAEGDDIETFLNDFRDNQVRDAWRTGNVKNE